MHQCSECGLFLLVGSSLRVAKKDIALHCTLLKAGVLFFFFFSWVTPLFFLKTEEEKENKLEEVMKEGCNRRNEEEMWTCLLPFLTVAFSFSAVTPGIPGPISEGSHLLLICSVTHLQGHERFQWKLLSSDPTNKKGAMFTSHNLKDHRSQTGPNLDIPQVSQKDVGIWECSVYGPEGRLGAVEYGLQITGTISCTSVTNLFFSPCSTALSFLLSVSPHPSLLWLLISHLSVILSHLSVPPAAPSSSLHPFPFCLSFCSPSLVLMKNQPFPPS